MGKADGAATRGGRLRAGCTAEKPTRPVESAAEDDVLPDGLLPGAEPLQDGQPADFMPVRQQLLPCLLDATGMNRAGRSGIDVLEGVETLPPFCRVATRIPSAVGRHTERQFRTVAVGRFNPIPCPSMGLGPTATESPVDRQRHIKPDDGQGRLLHDVRDDCQCLINGRFLDFE